VKSHQIRQQTRSPSAWQVDAGGILTLIQQTNEAKRIFPEYLRPSKELYTSADKWIDLSSTGTHVQLALSSPTILPAVTQLIHCFTKPPRTRPPPRFSRNHKNNSIKGSIWPGHHTCKTFLSSTSETFDHQPGLHHDDRMAQPPARTSMDDCQRNPSRSLPVTRMARRMTTPHRFTSRLPRVSLLVSPHQLRFHHSRPEPSR
jgi:hypothetical protein